MTVAETITEATIDPKDFHLGEINLQQMLDEEAALRQGKYEEEQFASYTAQRFLNVFAPEKALIEKELDKFVSETGRQRKVLYGYVTKTKESAHARMTAGVCVSGDNPGKSEKRCQWNMPNYLQFVFQDPKTLRCQGLVLMHHYENKDGKTLTVSINPSSTYILSVDEKALFSAIYKALAGFATENDFDRICVSSNPTIRTNRTKGIFEKAFEEAIAKVDKKYELPESQVFSYTPEYFIKDLDVIWEKS